VTLRLGVVLAIQDFARVFGVPPGPEPFGSDAPHLIVTPYRTGKFFRVGVGAAYVVAPYPGCTITIVQRFFQSAFSDMPVDIGTVGGSR
jgi:hypothetical protein